MVIYWPNITLPRGTAYGYHVHIDGWPGPAGLPAWSSPRIPSAPSDIAVTITPPNLFAPVLGKRNILFTMAETDSVPPRFAEGLKGADILVVPCRHNVNVFRSVYSGRIEVCPEGIDAELFPFHQRKAPAAGEPFRFLWCGSPDPRKGAGLLMYAWQQWAQSGRKPPDVQLYMKPPASAVGVEDRGFGVIVDGRNLPGPELAQLYRDAHAFILPSTGEGWGLHVVRCPGERAALDLDSLQRAVRLRRRIHRLPVDAPRSASDAHVRRP